MSAYNYLESRPMRAGELMGNLSGAAFGLGFVGLIFFWFFFGVTVNGVANLDAMNQRASGITISVGMIILGGLFQVCREVALLRAEKR